MSDIPATSEKSRRDFHIVPVRDSADLNATVELFSEYVASLNMDLAFQGWDAEIAGMPGKYSPDKGGELLLARRVSDGHVLGCVGLRALSDDGVCEMKRLYVAPAGRGAGVGRALVQAVVAVARNFGYREMRLDSLAHMVAARRLYEEVGFVNTEKYYDTPVEGTVFMAADLTRSIEGHTVKS